MSILFSGQQLTDIFSVTEIHVLHFLFPTGDEHYFFSELDLPIESFKLNEILTRHCFWAFKKGK